MRRFGIFAALRRRRLALSLAFGYALLLNALLASVNDAHALAAALDPLSASTALCGTHQPNTGGDQQGDQHQHECPLCGPICPMGGCLTGHALAGGLATMLPTTSGIDVQITWPVPDGVVARSVYRSDPRAQAPPALA
jgi:hypothetical protein